MATLTLDNRSTNSLTADTRNTAGSLSLDSIEGVYFLLLETGDYLLQEIGEKFILDSASGLTLDTKN